MVVAIDRTIVTNPCSIDIGVDTVDQVVDIGVDTVSTLCILQRLFNISETFAYFVDILRRLLHTWQFIHS